MTKRLTDAIDAFIGKLPARRDAAAAATKIEADWLLVTCIDCRYPHVVHEFMRRHHARQLYDQLALAGAALAATPSHTQRGYWATTFLEHVGMSIDLHNIRGVLILDHRTCGAYKEFGLLTDADDNSNRELEQHRVVAEEAADLAIEEFRKRAKAGIVQVLLVPEVKQAGADDFPSGPTPLYAVTA